ncbi:RWP-RK domain-containing [Chlorella sorokiniana]|uniref:RWP-RK domain-containing n=1 Tax=Chlorella sorokiniana TaxID=3076 RepID=A0A2P6U0J4_CHLSO|nr:RWP-RK domain-containing [Chlorella sorokiniana]|eukprot:PRW59842.1 RWP-RK domain-containing [Chlorella sorokiniana]
MSGPTSRSRKRTKAGVYTSDIGFEALAATFHMPSNQACEVLGVGLTIFKRLCRKFGLHRWPYRALKKQGKLMQQGKQVSTADLQRILSDCKVPFEWQSAAAAAAATADRPTAGNGRTGRARSGSGSGSGSDSDLLLSDEEEDDTGWEPNPSVRRRVSTRQAAQQQQQHDMPAWQPTQLTWGPDLGGGPAPFPPLPVAEQPPNSLLVAMGLAPLMPHPPLLRPTARPADASRIEQLQQGLMPAQQGLMQLTQGDPLASLLAGFSSVPASDRQQVALLLKQLADLLDQQSRAAAVRALVARLQQPPPGAAALAALLQQVQGGGGTPVPDAAAAQQPTPFSLAPAGNMSAPPPPNSNTLAALLSAASGVLPQPSGSALVSGPQAPPAQVLLDLLGAASASGSLPPSLNGSLRGELLALPEHLMAQLQAVQQEAAQPEAEAPQQAEEEQQQEEKPQPAALAAAALAAEQAAQPEPAAAELPAASQ